MSSNPARARYGLFDMSILGSLKAILKQAIKPCFRNGNRNMRCGPTLYWTFKTARSLRVLRTPLYMEMHQCRRTQKGGTYIRGTISPDSRGWMGTPSLKVNLCNRNRCPNRRLTSSRYPLLTKLHRRDNILHNKQCPRCRISQWIILNRRLRLYQAASHSSQFHPELFLRTDHRHPSTTKTCLSRSASKAPSHHRRRTHHPAFQTDNICSQVNTTARRIYKASPPLQHQTCNLDKTQTTCNGLKVDHLSSTYNQIKALHPTHNSSSSRILWDPVNTWDHYQGMEECFLRGRT